MEKRAQSFRKKTVINRMFTSQWQNYSQHQHVPKLHNRNNCVQFSESALHVILMLNNVYYALCLWSQQTSSKSQGPNKHKLTNWYRWKIIWNILGSKRGSGASQVEFHTPLRKEERDLRESVAEGVFVCVKWSLAHLFVSLPPLKPLLYSLSHSLSPFLPIPSHSPLQNNAVCHWKKPVAFLLSSRQSFVMENCTDGVTSTLGEGQLLKTVTAQEDAKEKLIYCIILYIKNNI